MEPAAAVTLPHTARAPAEARRHLHQLGVGWPPQVLDAALLAVSEAVTNAVRHGVGEIELCVAVGDGRIRIEVGDDGPEQPERRPPTGDGLGEGGRGLYLLDALTAQWGTELRTDRPGKTVWMEIPRS
jgi:anti-sigma regulatory factor (Ser/Thr protein kinase)